MNNQFFSVGIQKPNPAESGFFLNFAATDANQHAQFATGTAGVHFQRASFEITGIDFSGLNTLDLDDEKDRLVDQVNFNVKVSGQIPNEFNSENNSGALNIEKILVFTGESTSALDQVAPEFANFVITTDPDPDNLEINFSLSAEDLNLNTGVIFYRLIPFDRLGSGKVSDIVSGQLFTGFPEFQETFNERIRITRDDLNDLRFHRQRLILGSGATEISIDKNNVKQDFACLLELRTDEEIIISGDPNFPGTGPLNVQFVNPPNFTDPVHSGVAISGNFETFSLRRDTTASNTYIVKST